MAIREKVDLKRYDRIISSPVARIHYLGHALDYVKHLAPNGSSLELDALVEAGITLELSFAHMVWGE